MAVRTAILHEKWTAQEYIDWAKDPRAGAVVFFGGITRDNFDGKRVVSLAYDCYVPMAEKTLARIAAKTAQFPGVFNVALVHRIGDVPLSEESVGIVVACGHRQQAWDAAEYALEEVKHSTEIWKKEVYTDGTSSWIEQCNHKSSA